MAGCCLDGISAIMITALLGFILSIKTVVCIHVREYPDSRPSDTGCK